MKNKFWDNNAQKWIQVVDSKAIESRRVTNTALLKTIKDLKASSILDIGCGEGWLGRALFKKNEQIYYLGIDGSAKLVTEAKNRSHLCFEHVTYEQITTNNWSPKTTFSAIVFNFSLLEENIDQLLQSASIFLTPGGNLIIQTLHPCFQLNSYKDEWNHEDFKKTNIEFKNTMPWFGRTLSSWTALFKKSGLYIHKIIEPSMGEKPSSIIFVLRKREV